MDSKYRFDDTLVAFFDILGFSDLVQRAVHGDGPAMIAEIDSALRQSLEVLDKKWSWEDEGLSLTMFSDCACVSVPATGANMDAFFQIVPAIQARLARRRICVRGAMTIGKHFANERMIFSEGLVEAYRLESTVAEHPRVLISPELEQWVYSVGHDEDLIWFRDLYTWRDPQDQMLFADYLNFMPLVRRSQPEEESPDLRNHAGWIEDSIAEYRDRPRVRAKFEWMERYHNDWVSRCYPDHPDLLVA